MKALLSLLVVTLFTFIAPAQKFEWASQIGGKSSDYCEAIAVDALGNIIITGRFRDTADFDPGPNTFNLLSAGDNDVFVSKYDTIGNLIWAKRMGGTNWDHGKDVAIDTSGMVYTTGFFMDLADFDPGSGSFNLTSSGKMDVFISKLDPAGGFVWARGFGGPENDVGTSIAVDGWGNIYITGYFSGTADFDPGSGTYYMSSLGNDDAFVCKLDSLGNLIWAKQLGGTENVQAIGVALDIFGNVFTTGIFQGTADFDPGQATYNLTSMGYDADIFISKLDASGNFVWVKQLGGNEIVWTSSIEVDDVGNVYTTGWFFGTADFDPGSGTYNLSAAHMNAFLSKLDSFGNFVWAKQFIGITGAIGITSLDLDKSGSGNIYTTGGFDGIAEFDPGNSSTRVTSIGGADGFIAKHDSLGNFIRVNHLKASSHLTGNSIAVGLNSNIYTAGSFIDTAYVNAASVDFSFISYGEQDVFIHSLSGCTPPILSISSTNVLCHDDTASAIVSATVGTGALNYYWSNGDTTMAINGLSAGNYSVTVTDSVSCIAIASIDILQPPPYIPVLISIPSKPFPDCNGSSSIISQSGGTPPFTYTWNNGSFDSSITNVCAGTFYVTIVDGNGCSYEDSVVVDQVSGINGDPINSWLRVYPNPSSGQFTIDLQDFHQIEEMKLIDLLGRELMHWGIGDINSNTIQISLSGEPKGNFLLKVRIRETVYVVKLSYQ